MNQVKKIVIIFEDDTEFEVEVDGATIEQKAGITIDYTPGVMSANMSHNGQRTISIQGWKGCDSYEKFETDAKPC